MMLTKYLCNFFIHLKTHFIDYIRFGNSQECALLKVPLEYIGKCQHVTCFPVC